jgi:ferredoxin
MSKTSSWFNFVLVETQATSKQKKQAQIAGHFSEQHLKFLDVNPKAVLTYVCGPATLMQSVADYYSQQESSQLRQESFSPIVFSASSIQGVVPVFFSESAVNAQSAQQSLLEVAEQAGVNPMSGCRQGICRTCTCRKVSGVVRDLRTGELSSADAEYIPLCVSQAVGPVVLEL